MKIPPALLASAVCLALCCAPRGRADQLDDMIAAMRNGTPAPANRKEIMKTAGAAAGKAYTDSIVNLYLEEVKASIVDTTDNGGWPYRSFLVEDDTLLREGVAKGLRERYKEKPDPILAYALICPALYEDDAALVGRLESYLKDNDPFLFKLEQAQIAKYWRPYVGAVMKLIVAPQLLCKVLPYIASNGTDRELPPLFAGPLGFSASGATWSYRGIGVQDPDPEHVYGFAMGRGSDPDIMVSKRVPGRIHVFRASRDGKVIKALVFDLSTKQVTMSDPAEAQVEFDVVWNFWANEIDDLTASAGTK